jgi:hypothetical protein
VAGRENQKQTAYSHEAIDGRFALDGCYRFRSEVCEQATHGLSRRPEAEDDACCSSPSKRAHRTSFDFIDNELLKLGNPFAGYLRHLVGVDAVRLQAGRDAGIAVVALRPTAFPDSAFCDMALKPVACDVLLPFSMRPPTMIAVPGAAGEASAALTARQPLGSEVGERLTSQRRADHTEFFTAVGNLTRRSTFTRRQGHMGE